MILNSRKTGKDALSLELVLCSLEITNDIANFLKQYRLFDYEIEIKLIITKLTFIFQYKV